MRNKITRMALTGLVAASLTIVALGPTTSGTAHANPSLDGLAQGANGQVPAAGLFEGMGNPSAADGNPLASLEQLEAAGQTAEELQGLLQGGGAGGGDLGPLGSLARALSR